MDMHQETGHQDQPQRQGPPHRGGDKEEEGGDGSHHEERPRGIESACASGLVGQVPPEGRDGKQGDRRDDKQIPPVKSAGQKPAQDGAYAGTHRHGGRQNAEHPTLFGNGEIGSGDDHAQGRDRPASRGLHNARGDQHGIPL